MSLFLLSIWIVGHDRRAFEPLATERAADRERGDVARTPAFGLLEVPDRKIGRIEARGSDTGRLDGQGVLPFCGVPHASRMRSRKAGNGILMTPV